MKKSILIMAFALISFVSLGQGKTDTTRNSLKVQYEYFVKVPLNVFNQINQFAHQYRDMIPYDQFMEDNEKIHAIGNFDFFYKRQLSQLKIDSAFIIQAPQTPPVKKQ